MVTDWLPLRSGIRQEYPLLTALLNTYLATSWPQGWHPNEKNKTKESPGRKEKQNASLVL